MNKADIIDFIAKNRTHLEALGVEELSLFGSFAKGTQSDVSDIDFTVKISPTKPSLNDLLTIKFFFEDNLHRAIDLVEESAVHPMTKPYIMQDLERVL